MEPALSHRSLVSAEEHENTPFIRLEREMARKRKGRQKDEEQSGEKLHYRQVLLLSRADGMAR